MMILSITKRKSGSEDNLSLILILILILIKAARPF